MAREPLLIAGIGASAGGLDALQSLLRPLATDTGIAFVLVTHMARGVDSALPEILSRQTRMPVTVAADDARIEADHLYVCPPGCLLTVGGGRLRLQQDAVAHHKPIDVFLSSLAHDKGDAAIGILLSGGGSDGAIGIKHIKELGGLTIAQGAGGSGPKQSSMPDTAIAAGVVDLVLPVDDMPGRLAEYARNVRAGAAADDGEAARAAKDGYEPIYELLLEQVGHDFSGYKAATFARRVQRRMVIVQLDALAKYIDLLRWNSAEVRALFHDLLIGVTNFFRDPDAFAILEKTVIPKLFQDRGAGDAVRIWVPGCATGEEVYSLAMLVREHLDQLPEAPKVQLFATDIDEAALAVARAGRYPATTLASVSKPRLARFFTGDAASKVVSRSIRDLCTFSSHSVVRDPPFSRIDLVSCRNLLIYLGPEFQSRVIPVFHFALCPGGYLFLGTSESIGQYADLFAPVESKQRIFQRRDNVKAPVRLPLYPRRDRGPRASGDGVRPTTSTQNLQKLVQTRIAEQFAPAHVVVNRDGEVLFYSRRTGNYLEAAAGVPEPRLVSMARPGLRPELRSALREAIDTGGTVTRRAVEVEVGDRLHCVMITVERLGGTDDDPRFLVVFMESGQPVSPSTRRAQAEANPDDGVREELEKELRETRQTLQTTIEAYESSVDELKSANEELQSMNEEFQSTNEEMDTSNEELQSLNEEMNTVNAELSAKIEQLDTANADLRNILNSTGIATIFLDRQLVIRSFTAAAINLFNLLPRDHGRPLTDIVPKLDAVGALTGEVREVLDTGRQVRRRVQRSDGSAHYLMHILPYITQATVVDGALITFVEVTELVESEGQLRTVVEELNHRVRNMLAVVGSIANQTLATTPAPDAFATAFLGRIHSMAKSYSLISEAQWGSVSLATILATELEPYRRDDSDRIAVDGPDVAFAPQQALAMGLVFHELATNAAKYGALSTTEGNIKATWQLKNGLLQVDWIETGGPKPRKRRTPGFGTRLISSQVRAAFGAEVRYDYGATGLQVSFAMPRDSFLSETGN